MTKAQPLTVLVTYKLKTDAEQAFLPLLKKHWPTLDKAGLVTAVPPTIWRAVARDESVSYVEVMEWKDAQAPDLAHQMPEVMQIWEPMGPLLASLDIQHVEPARL